MDIQKDALFSPLLARWISQCIVRGLAAFKPLSPRSVGIWAKISAGYHVFIIYFLNIYFSKELEMDNFRTKSLLSAIPPAVGRE